MNPRSKTIYSKKEKVYQSQLDSDKVIELIELQMENETLKRTNQNLEELLKVYNSNGMSTSATSSRKSSNDDQMLHVELQNKLTDLERKLFLSEQAESNVKRTNQALNLEMSNLKKEIDKLIINNRKPEESHVKRLSCATPSSNFSLNIEEEAKNIINELLNEVDELKQEKNEISERALNLLTEKEVQLMELREQLEEIKAQYKYEISQLNENIFNLKGEIDENDYFVNNKSSPTKQSEDQYSEHNENLGALNSEEIVNKYKTLKKEYEKFKQDTEKSEEILIREKAKLKKESEKMEITFKKNISDLKIEITKLKTELTNKENDRIQLEKEIKYDVNNNDALYQEIKTYQLNISQIEEEKEKSEQFLKDQIDQLNSDLKDLKNSYSIIEQQKSEMDKELNKFIPNAKKSLKKQETLKNVKSYLTQENETLKLNVEKLTKEKEKSEKELFNVKKDFEKFKFDFFNMTEDFKKSQENQLEERKKWEENFYKLEKKFEDEKHALIRELKDKENNSKSFNSQETLSDILNIPHDKILEFQDEIEKLNNRITENKKIILDLSSKLLGKDKLVNENDILKKEISKLKIDIKEIKSMYEKQIKEMDEKAFEMNNELMVNKRKQTMLRSSVIQNPKQIQASIIKLNGENKFLNEKIEIFSQTINNLKILREEDSLILRTENALLLEQAINSKLQLATKTFESDLILQKYQKAYLKIKNKLFNPNNVIR